MHSTLALIPRRSAVATAVVLGAVWPAGARPAGAAGMNQASAGGPRLSAAARAGAVEAPDDPLFKHQWHLHSIQIPEAWAVSRGTGATVAVLDTGVAYEDRGAYRRAPDLAGTRFVRGWDFVDGDSHPNDEVPTGSDVGGGRSHGSHITGIIAQTTGNGVGGAGVAPEAAIMPIRVLEPDLSGSARAIARGLRFAADRGADVANLSIAGPSDSRVVRQAVTYASSRGVTVVASAGNDGRSTVSYPGAYKQVISVGAVLRDKTRAYYSNYGSALDLVAPGGDDQGFDGGTGPPGGVLQQTLKGDRSTFCYCFMASTSAAAAQVSGVAALVVASGRATAPAEVRSALISNADDLGPPGRDPEFGAGAVQAARAVGAAESARRGGGAASGAGPSVQPRLIWLGVAVAVAGLAGVLLILKRRRQPGA